MYLLIHLMSVLLYHSYVIYDYLPVYNYFLVTSFNQFIIAGIVLSFGSIWMIFEFSKNFDHPFG